MGVKLFAVCDQHGSLLDLELQPANTDDRVGVLPRLAALGFKGDLLGDSGFKGASFTTAVPEHDIHVSISSGGTRDGRFLQNGIRGLWSGYSLGSAATGASTSSTTVPPTSLLGTSGLR